MIDDTDLPADAPWWARRIIAEFKWAEDGQRVGS